MNVMKRAMLFSNVIKDAKGVIRQSLTTAADASIALPPLQMHRLIVICLRVLRRICYRNRKILPKCSGKSASLLPSQPLMHTTSGLQSGSFLQRERTRLGMRPLQGANSLDFGTAVLNSITEHRVAWHELGRGSTVYRLFWAVTTALHHLVPLADFNLK